MKMKVISEMKKKLYCQKEGHMQQSIDYICDEDRCNTNKLCCYICQLQQHKFHSMRNITLIMNKILEIKIRYTESLQISAIFDNRVNEIINFLSHSCNQFNDYQGVYNSFYQYIEMKKNKAISVLEFYRYIENICKLDVGDFQDKLEKFMVKNFVYFENEKFQREEVKNIYSNVLENIHEELKFIIKTLNKLQKENKISDYEVLALFPIEEQGKFLIFRPHFCQHYKGTNMKITSNTAQMVMSNSQRVLALEPSLEVGSRVKRWKVKITKLNSWIGVGACHINKLKEANWFFNYNASKHGSYFISSNGYSWSSYKPEFNSKFETFTFQTGDVIVIEFRINEKKLFYSKENTNDVYEIEVEITSDPLHPAVNLTGLGDAVEIVE